MAACTTIPCSPSWYLSQVLDCSWDNKLAYGSLVNIVIINPSDPYNPSIITSAHADRILSVSFAPKSFGNYLLSTCAKGLSIIWDLDSQKASAFHKQHKNNSTFGNWSHSNENLIVCADDNGGFSWWDANSNVLNATTFAGHMFNVVTCCPHREELVAAGTKQGITCIINLSGKGSILHKLQDHGVEVVSIAWCPVIGNIFKSKSAPNECMFSTAARDRSVHFWSVGRDSTCEARCELPSSWQKSPGTNFSNWTCLSWPHPDLLLATAIGGEIFSLKITDISSLYGSQLVGRAANRDKKVKWQQLALKHGRGHVTVHCRPWRYCDRASDYNWRAENAKHEFSELVWTSGSDRMIHGLSLGNGNVNIKINTVGSAIYSLAVSPIDGHSLAVGVADKSIRLVNLSESDFSNMKTIFIKHNAKVMSLSWHPLKDGWLAYGTSDGHVEIHFVHSSKHRLSFKKYSKESIYVLQWGPLLSLPTKEKEQERNKESEKECIGGEMFQFVLYSVGGGRVAIHNPDQPDNEPLDPIQSLLPNFYGSGKEKQKVTDLSWKPDYTILAIGSDKGGIHLFYLNRQRTLKFVTTVKEHSTLIQDLSWHPQSCTSDVSESSTCSNWLGSASNDVTIRVIDVTSLLDVAKDAEDCSQFENVKVPCIAKLEGHRMRVAKLSWSPHQSGQLLSASYDQCVQVWDVLNRQPTACYVSHGNPVLTCLWSPVNADVAISGGMDITMRVWKISEQDHKLVIEKKTDSKYHLKDAHQVEKCATAVNVVDGKNSMLDLTCAKCRKRKEKAVLPLSGQSINDEALNSAILQHLLQLPDEESSNDKEIVTKSLPHHYGIFGDEAALAVMLNAEYEANCASACWESTLIIDTWRGRVKEAISDAIKNNRLSDFHVSLASMVSHKTWVDTCSAYADQLKEGKEFSKASTFLLAVHRVGDAIQLLMDNGKFRQALAIARSRLAADDPTIQEILNAWAKDSTNLGKFSIASVCLAATGQWDEAARVVVRKPNPARLLLAAKMTASKGNDKTTGFYYARECFYLSLKTGDWDTSRAVLQSFPDLSHLALLFQVHHSLFSFRKCKQISVIEWLNNKIISTSEVNECTDTSGPKSDPALCTIGKEMSDSRVLEALPLKDEMIPALMSDLECISTDTKDDALWLAVSSRVSLAIALAPGLFTDVGINVLYDGPSPDNTPSIKEALICIIQAMSLLYNHLILHGCKKSTTSHLMKLCMWLFPKGNFESSRILSTQFETLHATIQSYISAAVIFWLEDACSKVEDDTNWKQGLKIVDHFKTDLFSLESLKWFKNDLQHRLLQTKKLSEQSVKAKDQKKDTVNVGVQHAKETEVHKNADGEENVKAKDQKKDTVNVGEEHAKETEAHKNADGEENVKAKDQKEDTVNVGEEHAKETEVQKNADGEKIAPGSAAACVTPGDSDFERLSIWLNQFEEERGKVPNPFVCYSRLIMFLKNISGEKVEAVSLLASYQKLWDDVNSQLNLG